MMSIALEQRLHDAVRKNDLDSVRRLVEAHGTDIDCVYYGTTPLLLAVQQGHVDLALWLLDRNCNIYKTDVNKNTVFEEAVYRDQVQVVQRVIEKGIDANSILSNGQTALIYAVSKNLARMSRTLVEGGADVNLSNCQGETALYIAAKQGHTVIMEILLKAETISTDVPCGSDGMTPLMAAVFNEQLTTTELLLKSGCNADVKDSCGWTALWYAVTASNELFVKALVEAGADVSTCDADGKTLLEEAQDNDSEEIIEILTNARRYI